MEEEEIPLAPVEEEVKVLQYENQFLKVLSENASPIGDGSLIGLKIALQIFANEKPAIISGDFLLSRCKTEFPMLHASDPAAAAEAASKETRSKGIGAVICIDDENNTLENISSLARSKGNFTYICFSQEGGTADDMELAKMVGRKAAYSATASISNIEDYATKLLKCRERRGMKFIELLAPDPHAIGIDTADTVSIARHAVNSLFWPLYEIDRKAAVTSIPDKTEDCQRYLDMRGKIYPKDEMEEIRDKIDKRWKRLLKGAFF